MAYRLVTAGTLLTFYSAYQLRCVDPLLGNDRQTSKYTTAVTKKRPLKQVMCPQQQENSLIKEKMFSVWSVTKCFN